MKPFHYCPACGARLGEGMDADEGAECGSCGRNWYRNPVPTAGAAIVDGERALITRRGIEPNKGMYDIPGGFLQPGEDPIAGLKRELREELGVEIDVGIRDLVCMAPHPYGEEDEPVLAFGFKARLASGEPRAASDVADFRWVKLDELDGIDFAWPHDREVVRRALTDGEE